MACWQPQEPKLQYCQNRHEKKHRIYHALRCTYQVVKKNDYAQRAIIPAIMTAIIGPIEASPINPKPSDIADLPARTELSPIPKARIIGALNAPVVTLPESYASGTNSGGVKNDRIITIR